MMEDSEKKRMDEKRVKPTVIRRRASAPPPPVVATPQVVKTIEQKRDPASEEAKPALVQGESVTSQQKEATSPVAEQEIPLTGIVKEKEEKIKKGGVKKKKSKAELDLEEIQRAGGLMKYAEEERVDWEPPSVVERVFEPTLTMGRRKKAHRREFKRTEITETKASKKIIRMEQGITVSEISQAMGVKSADLIKKLMGWGVMATANQALDVDTATLLASEYGHEVQHTAFKEEEVLQQVQTPTTQEIRSRAPIVTIMGHVDHGKTSLLDAIRKTKVTEQEAGGITQHIGAYEVLLPQGPITFIDTPGHEAFTRMRARGAKVTDIVILVVAADDGIMPQTVEAIDHAKAAGVPIIVAINKIDKPQSDLERVKRGLTEHGLVPEDWGGDCICVGTSAKTGQGLHQLLEMILLVAQMRELKANFSGLARGIILESRLDKGRGVVATVLVQEGFLKVGGYAVAGLSHGKIRAMMRADGSLVKQAHPSMPVEILGLQEVPLAGDAFFVVESERDAKHISQTRQTKKRAQELAGSSKLTLETLQEKIVKGEIEELPIVLKADVGGVEEALVEALNRLSTEKVKVKILHHGTGGITENDVILAQASQAVIVGFNVVPESKARKLAETSGIVILSHSIIYEVLDAIKKAMQGLLAPTLTEKFMGRAEVRQVFKISKTGTIAGLMVTEGLIRRGLKVRLIREGAIVYQGNIASLKRFKEDVREVSQGMECGLGIENFGDIKEKDIIETIQIESTQQTL